jgi:hypothetical protein
MSCLGSALEFKKKKKKKKERKKRKEKRIYTFWVKYKAPFKSFDTWHKLQRETWGNHLGLFYKDISVVVTENNWIKFWQWHLIPFFIHRVSSSMLFSSGSAVTTENIRGEAFVHCPIQRPISGPYILISVAKVYGHSESTKKAWKLPVSVTNYLLLDIWGRLNILERWTFCAWYTHIPITFFMSF